MRIVADAVFEEKTGLIYFGVQIIDEHHKGSSNRYLSQIDTF